MSKKKLAIMITSLCLVFVAAVAAVVAVIAAANIGINSSLNVTYTPAITVYAEVESFYKKQTASTTTPIGSKQNFVYGTTSSTGANIDPGALTLNDTDTYIVFCFSFKNTVPNDANAESAKLNVTVTDNKTSSNMDVAIGYSATALATADLTYAKVNALTDKSGAAIKGLTKDKTGYMYVAVQRKEGRSGSFGTKSGASSTFAFNLATSA